MKIMQQYNELKEKHPDCIILFRKNNAYVAYEDDALTCAKALKMSVIVNRRIGSEDYGITYISFPLHAIDIYLPKLVRAGHRIAICDYPDPNEKKLVKRGVPPTISDDSARK